MEEVATLARQRGLKVEVFHVGEIMYRLDPKIPTDKILNIDYHRLDFLARQAYKRVNQQSQGHSNAIVNAHATFRWRFGLFRAFDIRILREFQPSLLVTAIDNAPSVKANLQRHKDELARRLMLKDVLTWREEEIMATDIFAEALSTPSKSVRHYVAAIELGVETWYSLLFEPHRRKVYASYPITQIRGNSRAQAEKSRFLKFLKRHFVVFDPSSISEREIIYEADSARGRGKRFIDTSTRNGAVRLSIDEIEAVRRDVDSQIIARDFKLIDQADLVFAFVPIIEGRPSISAGVERELQHAYETGKDTFILCESPEKLSPFSAMPATSIFRGLREAQAWGRTLDSAGMTKAKKR